MISRPFNFLNQFWRIFLPGNIQWGEKSDEMCQLLGRAGLWQCLQGAGCRRSSSGGILLSYFYLQRPTHTGFLLSTETTTSLSLAAIALHLLEVGQHEREGLVLIGATWREKAMEMVVTKDAKSRTVLPHGASKLLTFHHQLFLGDSK